MNKPCFQMFVDLLMSIQAANICNFRDYQTNDSVTARVVCLLEKEGLLVNMHYGLIYVNLVRTYSNGSRVDRWPKKMIGGSKVKVQLTPTEKSQTFCKPGCEQRGFFLGRRWLKLSRLVKYKAVRLWMSNEAKPDSCVVQYNHAPWFQDNNAFEPFLTSCYDQITDYDSLFNIAFHFFHIVLRNCGNLPFLQEYRECLAHLRRCKVEAKPAMEETTGFIAHEDQKAEKAKEDKKKAEEAEKTAIEDKKRLEAAQKLSEMDHRVYQPADIRELAPILDIENFGILSLTD